MKVAVERGVDIGAGGQEGLDPLGFAFASCATSRLLRGGLDDADAIAGSPLLR
jgi:hypothetical protein